MVCGDIYRRAKEQAIDPKRLVQGKPAAPEIAHSLIHLRLRNDASATVHILSLSIN
jgi:hypothetical protein